MAIWASAAEDGVSIEETMETFSVSRRTAERMRDVLGDIFQIREMDPDGRRKRWRIEAGALARLFAVDADTLADIETGARMAEMNQNAAIAERLRGLGDALKARIPSSTRNKLAPDIEALVEAEGFALRPGPRETCRPDIMDVLRRALLSGCHVVVDHRARSSGKLSRGQKLGVLGFLYGPHRRYLVAWSEYAKAQRLYAVSGFEAAELTNEPFTLGDGFALDGYIAKSFGVFQEEPVQVAWRFDAEIADEASKFVFHPGQTCVREPDGALLVSFVAGGLDEMCWHLFSWAPHVEVLKPPELRERYKACLQAALERCVRSDTASQ